MRGGGGQPFHFDALGQQVTDRGFDAVCGAAACRLDHPIGGGVDDIDVIARAAVQPVNPRSTMQGVGSGRAGQHVIAQPAIQDVIAGLPVDHVIAAKPKQRIGPGRAGHRAGRVVTAQHHTVGEHVCVAPVSPPSGHRIAKRRDRHRPGRIRSGDGIPDTPTAIAAGRAKVGKLRHQPAAIVAPDVQVFGVKCRKLWPADKIDKKRGLRRVLRPTKQPLQINDMLARFIGFQLPAKCC